MVVQILSGIHLEFFFCCFRKTLPNRDLNSGPFVKNYNAPTQPSELSHLLNHHRSAFMKLTPGLWMSVDRFDFQLLFLGIFEFYIFGFTI